MDAAYFVYEDGSRGWEYRCNVCGLSGPGELRERATDDDS